MIEEDHVTIITGESPENELVYERSHLYQKFMLLFEFVVHGIYPLN